MSIISVKQNKKLDIPSLTMNFSAEFDNDSIKQQINLPLEIGNIGLNSMDADIFLLIENKNGMDIVELTDKELSEDGKNVITYWLVKRSQVIPDTINIQIKVQDKINDIVWLSQVRELSIISSLNAENNIVELYPTILEQLEQKLNNSNEKLDAFGTRLINLEQKDTIGDAPSDNQKYGRKNAEWVSLLDRDYIGVNNENADIIITNTNISTIEVNIKDSPRIGGKLPDKFIEKSVINAQYIIFKDGESLQQKFDNGTLSL